MTMTAAIATREWLAPGDDLITKAYASRKQTASTVRIANVRARIAAEVDVMTWKAPNGRHPFSPGMTLQAVVEAMDLRGVTAVSYSGILTIPDGPETATACVLGIEFGTPAKRYRLYLADLGGDAYPLALDCNVPEPALPV